LKKDPFKNVYELVHVFEFIFRFPKESIPTRVELYRNFRDKKIFKANLWQAENFHVRPKAKSSLGHEGRGYSTQNLSVQRNWHLGNCWKEFRAKGLPAAKARLMQEVARQFELGKYLN
jgi:hypothetical protein